MREEEAAWRAAADRLHRQQEEYLQLLEREATRSTDDLIEEYTLPERKPVSYTHLTLPTKA